MRARGSPFERLFWRATTLVVLVYVGLPLAWIVSLSLKPASDLADGHLIPRHVTLDHYRAVFANPHFPAAMRNSLAIASLATVLALGLGMLAAYAVVRLRFPGRRYLLGGSLAVAMFPPVAIVGPLFDLWRRAGLYDTWTGLVLPYLSLTLPLAIWTLAASFRDLPWDLERAARVDGATRMQALRRIILPLAAPGIAATAVLVFIFAWNDFMFALSLTSTDHARTVPAMLAFFTGASRFQQPTSSIAAASVVVTVPVVALVLVFNRPIVAGLTAGAVKG
ncbi:MAG: carbohydrate ABC transporter permease [Gemmatimonadetes bacterium]|nr:carbohydrate ABC transporter permease [Gemmatimonadota bacterium]